MEDTMHALEALQDMDPWQEALLDAAAFVDTTVTYVDGAMDQVNRINRIMIVSLGLAVAGVRFFPDWEGKSFQLIFGCTLAVLLFARLIYHSIGRRDGIQ